jgi:hypothetical protein
LAHGRIARAIFTVKTIEFPASFPTVGSRIPAIRKAEKPLWVSASGTD